MPRVVKVIDLPGAIRHTGPVTESGTATRRESVTSKETVRGPVLVVDSDPAVRRVVRLVLEGAGWRTHTAADIPSAEAIISEHRPKLVLSELNLDGPTAGQELARRIAASGGWRPRVALMSAYPRPRRGYEDYFLSKPLEFDQLIRLLGSIDREPGW